MIQAVPEQMIQDFIHDELIKPGYIESEGELEKIVVRASRYLFETILIRNRTSLSIGMNQKIVLGTSLLAEAITFGILRAKFPWKQFWEKKQRD